MPTQTTVESPHQRQMRLDRDARHRNAQWDRVLDQHRGETEQADALNRRASRIEGVVSRYDNDEQFRERVTEERAAQRNMIKIVAYCVLIAVADMIMATPDVVEMWASKAMTFVPKALTPVEIINGHELVITPVWWRLCVAGVGVALFLAITLGWKSATNESKLHLRRNAVEPGDTRNYYRLTFGIWFRRVFKLVYMGVLGLLFYHLYDYDLQRSKLIAQTMLAESQMEQAGTPQALGTDGAAQPASNSGSNAQDATASPDSGEGLAKASAVVFCCLWLLHGILFLLPTDGFGKELEFAGFRRAKAEAQATAMREEEVGLLRGIRDRMFSVPEGAQRDQLLRMALPVGARINQVSGFDVIPRELLASVPVSAQPVSSVGAAAASSPVHHGNNGHSHPSTSSAPINGANGHNPVGDNDAPVADWDAIFPPSRPA
jgi:hypothetical protein